MDSAGIITKLGSKVKHLKVIRNILEAKILLDNIT